VVTLQDEYDNIYTDINRILLDNEERIKMDPSLAVRLVTEEILKMFKERGVLQRPLPPTTAEVYNTLFEIAPGLEDSEVRIITTAMRRMGLRTRRDGENMTYTQHGHRVAGTPAESGPAEHVTQCGGPAVCPVCKNDAENLLSGLKRAAADGDRGIPPYTTKREADGYMIKARQLVRIFVEDHFDVTDNKVPNFDTFVVWFSKTLQNWKALVSTTLPDGKYYEVTYDGDQKRTYVDAYVKFDNQTVTDDEHKAHYAVIEP
jgi:uncharacterized protein DUF6275